MKFDPKTGKLILPSKLEEKGTIAPEIPVVDPTKEEETLPVTSFECPKCANRKAYYWIVQTRASDEPETKFLKCTKCKNIIRDYS